jgi:plasmid maintenance system killer protein
MPSSQQARQHKGLKRLYEDNSSKGLRPDLVERVVTLLGYLEAAGEIGDLEIPSLRLPAQRRSQRALVNYRPRELAHHIQVRRRRRFRY